MSFNRSALPNVLVILGVALLLGMSFGFNPPCVLIVGGCILMLISW